MEKSRLVKFTGKIDYNKSDVLVQIGSKYYSVNDWYFYPHYNDILGILDPENEYYIHHTATRRAADFGGYINACVPTRYLPYSGRFGTGYVCVTSKTNVYVYVTYLIKKEGD